MSLWSVDDCATSDFMGLFYGNLKNGQAKDKALQNAKIEFVNSSPKEKQHPFYWASFIMYGNMEPVSMQPGFKLKYLLIGAAALLVILILMKFKNN